MIIKRKIIYSVLFSILLIIIFIITTIGKKGVGQITDKLGFTNNEYEIEIDDELALDTYIYWYSETENAPKDNRVLIYHRSTITDIPDAYGINGFEIKYKNKTYDKISFWRIFPYAKYKYYIKIKSLDSNMIVDWKISNWYDTDVYQGRDTISIYPD